jgi:hypothetical protein
VRRKSALPVEVNGKIAENEYLKIENLWTIQRVRFSSESYNINL